MLEDCALIERALVGHLASIERGRRFEHDGAAAGAKRCRWRRTQTSPAARAEHSRTAAWLSTADIGASAGKSGVSPRQASTSATSSSTKDVVAIVSGDHRIADVGCEVRDESCAERPDADPRAGREFEVFLDAAIEDRGPYQCLAIDRFRCIAHAIEPFIVEGLTRQGILPPIAGRHVRAADPHLQFFRHRHQLGLDAQAQAGRWPTTPRLARAGKWPSAQFRWRRVR